MKERILVYGVLSTILYLHDSFWPIASAHSAYMFSTYVSKLARNTGSSGGVLSPYHLNLVDLPSMSSRTMFEKMPPAVSPTSLL
jgi:hypothetical protein